MTDRTDHRAEAERLLADADLWTAQAGEPTPEAGERVCLDRAQVHALLAIHDALADLKPEPVTVTHPWSNPLTATHPWPPWPSTLPVVDAADRYAANEERQREELLEDAWQFRDWETVSRLQDEAEQREAAEPNPLDEDDHRDRLDAGGTRWTRAADECWSNGAHHVLELISLPGPLTFAPDADGAPSATAPADDDPVDDAVDGEEGERRYLNAQTGHERARLTAQLRQVTSSVQDSGDLTELDALADAWEAGTNG